VIVLSAVGTVDSEGQLAVVYLACNQQLSQGKQTTNVTDLLAAVSAFCFCAHKPSNLIMSTFNLIIVRN
jgi:hypothetical protein